MKKLAWLLGGILSPAYAVDFEASIGAAKFHDLGNMTWYQEGLPHQLHLTTPAIELGVTGDIVRGLAWHLGYVYLGRVRTDAVATPDDANYNKETKSCNGQCIAHSNFTGRGDSHGVKITLEPYVTYRGWRIGIEGGAYISKNRWAVTVYDWIPNPGDGMGPRTIRVDDDSGWRASPVVGMSVGKGNWSIVYRHYWNKSPGPGTTTMYPAIWSRTQTLSVRYRF